MLQSANLRQVFKKYISDSQTFRDSHYSMVCIWNVSWVHEVLYQNFIPEMSGRYLVMTSYSKKSYTINQDNLGLEEENADNMEI